MDFDTGALFGGIKRKVAWLTQRQEVLADNIANSDTPKARAVDLKPFAFERLLKREQAQVAMAGSSPMHLEGQVKRIRDFDAEQSRKPFETAIAGNAIVLEEQMGKLNETGVNHSMMTQLYRKHLTMFRTALGRGG